jgi:uncharacterized protein involved in exopolysaccharide biosynthesis
MSQPNSDAVVEASPQTFGDDPLLQFWRPLAESWPLLVIGPMLVAGLTWAATFLVKPSYTAQTTLLFPERAQSSSSSALQSIGALAGLAGVGGGNRTGTDQFAALLLSANVLDELVTRFDLVREYDKRYKVDARQELEKRLRVTVGKKDMLLKVEVDDTDPARAMAMANRCVDELRRLTSMLAVTEAQQRRMFFEAQLAAAQKKLTSAQQSLESSGFSQRALRTEPRAAADAYAQLKAAVTSAQVKIQTMRGTMADSATEMQQQRAYLAALEAQLGRIERPADGKSESDYIGKLREFKYQETLFELMARQYELARVDESRDAALIQVVDAAALPERPSKPRRLMVAAIAGTSALFVLLLFAYVRDTWRRTMADPGSAQAWAQWRRGRGV